MTLPNAYAAPVTPDAALIKLVQDCIIGMKHPEIEAVLPASAFVPTTAATALSVLAGQAWTLGGGGALDHYASLAFVPVGSRITSASVEYIVAATGSVTAELVRVKMSDGTLEVIATETDATGTTREAGPLAAINHTVVTGYAYYLHVTSTNDVSTLQGASVKRDRL